MNSKFTSTQIIAKEGWKNIAVAFALFLFMCLADADALSHILFIVLAAMLFIYRNPERIAAEDDPFAIIAAADGKVTAIDRSSEFGQQGVYVKIDSFLFNVGMIRFPTDTVLLDVQTTHGLFLSQNNKLSKNLNERVVLKCSHKKTIYFIKLRAGMFCKKIHIAKESRNFRAGGRFAFMTDGTIEMYLPLNSRINVSVGDVVKGGESVMGYFEHKKELHGK